MIKSKNKVICLLLMIATCVFLFGGVMSIKSNKVFAESSKYRLQYKYVAVCNGIQQATDTSYNYSPKISSFNNSEFVVYVYNSLNNGTVSNVPIGGNFAFSNFTVETTLSSSLTVYNSSNNIVYTGSGTKYIFTLNEGKYSIRLKYIWKHTSHGTTVTWNYTFDSSFYVDWTKPIINGASISTIGKYVNTSTSFSASDSGSGLKGLFVKMPSSSSFTNVGSSYTISASGANGLYRFYALDNGGNNSGDRYVYLDTVKPNGRIVSNGKVITLGSYISSDFSYLASDGGSGLAYCEILKPSSNSWVSFTNGSTISKSSGDGRYSFRAFDVAGNVSDTLTVYLDTTKPEGILYGGENIIQNGKGTNASFVKFVGSDNLSGIKEMFVKTPKITDYISYRGVGFTENGEYSFYCTDNVGNTSITYSIVLDNVAPVLTATKGSFGNTINESFAVIAYDELSLVNLYYKKPNMSEFVKSLSNKVSISSSEEDGEYEFYAIDSLGNKSETKTISLYVQAPIAQIIKADDSNKIYICWADNNCTGKLNGKELTNGTWIVEEGNYNFVITNSSNRSRTYAFNITHYYVVDKTVNHTCEEGGYTLYKCISCDSNYKEDETFATGHSYSLVKTESTCDEKGYTTYICTRCGSRFTSNYVDELGHDFGNWYTVVKETCTDNGLERHDCKRCQYYEERTKYANGHDYIEEIIKPTCTEGGYTKFTCSHCDEGYITNYIDALGHDYVETLVKPTCTEKGYILHKCNRCDYEYKTDETNATGHTYTEQTVFANCTESGGTKHLCVVCGYSYITETEKPLGHNYESELILEPNCTIVGERRFHCSRCDDEYLKEIPACGHEFEIDHTEKEKGVTTRTYVCVNCGEKFIQDLGDQYEKVSNYMEYLFNEYRPYMLSVFLGTAGVWSIIMGIMIIIAKKNEEKEKARKMVVNYCIGMVVIFAILVACPYLVKGISLLVS